MKILKQIIKILGVPFMAVIFLLLSFVGCIMTWGLADPKQLREDMWKDYWNE